MKILGRMVLPVLMGIIRICFWKDVLNDYEAKDYKLDLDKIEMWPYETMEIFR